MRKGRGDEDLKDYYEEGGWKFPTDERRQRDKRTEAALTIITSMGLLSVFFALFAGWRGATLGAIVGALWGAYRLWTGET
ncbi:hypothetical protein D2917_31435 (plasmid) [Cupriavidus oxalaticus]|uniref:Uncharacterized protein n=1 Tax=Cupriavidus oxalaticus TaxID=96344 RepID=A0A5P3VT00_9BURK|nr:hypothetical protein D2917_31435 [Cupriavidus oxalaticus]